MKHNKPSIILIALLAGLQLWITAKYPDPDRILKTTQNITVIALMISKNGKDDES